MDRREMLKGAAAITAGGMLPAGFAYGEHTQSLDTRWSDKARGIPEPKPYDPIAVLEAMRDRSPNMFWSICSDSSKRGVLASFSTPNRGTGAVAFPDFPSAVQWLHRQAAAVDAEFAKAFPVPE